MNRCKNAEIQKYGKALLKEESNDKVQKDEKKKKT